jgi:HemY protein
MRWLISILIIAVLAVALAMAGRYDPGYVVLVYPPWRMEISFISFVLMVVGLVVGGVVLLRLALLTLNLPGIVREQRERRAAKKRDENFVGGLRAYAEYRYQDAEQSLGLWQGDEARTWAWRVCWQRAPRRKCAPCRNASATSRKPPNTAPNWPRSFSRRKPRLDMKDATGALTAIQSAKLIAPQHTALLRLELKARQMTGQWDEVDKLLDALTRSNALDPSVATQVRRKAYARRISSDAPRTTGRCWNTGRRSPAEYKADTVGRGRGGPRLHASRRARHRARRAGGGAQPRVA